MIKVSPSPIKQGTVVHLLQDTGVIYNKLNTFI